MLRPMKASPLVLRLRVLVYGLLAGGAGIVGGLYTWVTVGALMGKVDPDVQPLWPLALLTALLGWVFCFGLARLARRDFRRLR